MRTTLSTKGRLVLPAELRARDGIEPGREFDVERIEAGVYQLQRCDPRSSVASFLGVGRTLPLAGPPPDREPPPNAGLVDWLLACPERDWFTPVASESTDTL